MSKISNKLDAKIRLQAGNRCGYCLTPQELVSQKLDIEHIFSKEKGGTDDEENLWLACRECNSHKFTKTHGFDSLTFAKVELFNPRKQIWSEHFEWDKSETKIIGKTPCGRATVDALQMNSEWQMTARSWWKTTGMFPPEYIL